jgi:DNA-binding transcriptional regulator GbsR (MarR family)
MNDLDSARSQVIESFSRIAEFWGYPRVAGALYAALYLSPGPLSLDEMMPIVGVTKGSISTNIRVLEQLGMVHLHIRPGDRKDYYEADTDFWKIVRTLLERRQKPEFDKALHSIGATLDQLRSGARSKVDADLARFYEQRLQTMQDFFNTLDGVVATLLQIDRLRSDGLKALLPGGGLNRSKGKGGKI